MDDQVNISKLRIRPRDKYFPLLIGGWYCLPSIKYIIQRRLKYKLIQIDSLLLVNALAYAGIGLMRIN